MRFVTVRDLRLRGKEIWQALRSGEEAVLTVNGSPVAVLVRVREDGLEETVRAIRQVQAQAAVSRMRETAARRGLDRLGEQEVKAETRAARRERQQ
jgi:antitoxin (DNA-binding transcriptional repressor) of toxin-antitoxin stability system